MRTLAIGDIHGCDNALSTLLLQVAPTAEDLVVFLGDYIDRGPSTRQVLDRLIELSNVCRTMFLRWNHEVMILEAREDALKANLWRSYGGLEALGSYGAEYLDDWAEHIPRSHWEFLNRTERYFETPTHIFVHACLAPDLELPDQPDWMVFWEKFDRIQAHKSGKRIVCGHTPNHSGLIKDVGFAVCIDTGAVTRGWLTCLDVQNGDYWQATEKGNARRDKWEIRK